MRLLIGRHETRTGDSLWDTPTLLLQDLLHRALSPVMSPHWRCGTWLQHRCTSRNNHVGVVIVGGGCGLSYPEPRGKGIFYYVMIHLFLLISNLITKCRHSYSNSNVRREGWRLIKKTWQENQEQPSLGKKGHRVHEEVAGREGADRGGGLEKKEGHQGHSGPMVRWGAKGAPSMSRLGGISAPRVF
jgi:hypothetical protein